MARGMEQRSAAAAGAAGKGRNRRRRNVPLQELAHQLIELGENSAFMSWRLGERPDAVGRCKLLDDRVAEDLCESRFAPDKSLGLREVKRRHMRIEDDPASLEGGTVRAEAGIRAARMVLGQPGAASLRSATTRARSHGTEDHFFASLPSPGRVDAL